MSRTWISVLAVAVSFGAACSEDSESEGADFGVGGGGGAGGAGGGCSPDDCGVPPPSEGTVCDDGTVVPPSCEPQADGRCGWLLGECPPVVVTCGGRPGPCELDEICGLPVEVSQCAAAFDRWAYDAAAGYCKGFTWGGCGASANNFLSQEACEAACDQVSVCEDLSREVILLGGSLSYGECATGCQSTLVISATSLNDAPPCDEATLTVCDNAPGAPCTTHRGTLTGAGHRLARDLAAELDGVELMDRYGCPDCADGGASTVELDRHGVQSSHEYGAHSPPAELVAADAFVQGLIEALRTCTSTPDVDVLPGCVPR